MAQTFNPALQNVFAIGTSQYALLDARNSKQAVQEKNEVISEIDAMETMRGTNYTGNYDGNVSEALYGGSCYDCGSNSSFLGYGEGEKTEQSSTQKTIIMGLALIGVISVVSYILAMTKRA